MVNKIVFTKFYKKIPNNKRAIEFWQLRFDINSVFSDSNQCCYGRIFFLGNRWFFFDQWKIWADKSSEPEFEVAKSQIEHTGADRKWANQWAVYRKSLFLGNVYFWFDIRIDRVNISLNTKFEHRKSKNNVTNDQKQLQKVLSSYWCCDIKSRHM